MKIGINGRFLLSPFTGIGKYTKEVILSMAKHNSALEIFVFIQGMPNKELIEDFRAFSGIKIIELPEKNLYNAGLNKAHWEAELFPSKCIELGVDLIFSPYPAATRSKKIKTVMTVHDVIPWLLKDYKSKNLLTKLYRNQVLKCIKKANLILTVSDFSKEEIKRVIKIKEEKIVVIPNACSDIFSQHVEKNEMANVFKKFKLDVKIPYLFYVGGFDSRKNVKELIDMFVDYLIQYSDLCLVIAGKNLFEQKLYESFFYAVSAAKKFPTRIFIIGEVSEEELAIFYKKSWAYINLSNYEGYNLPIAEAIKSGTLPILSDTKIHNEVAGKIGFYLENKLSTVKKAQQIAKLRRNYDHYEEKIKELKSADLTRLSWDNTGKLTLTSFEKLFKV